MKREISEPLNVALLFHLQITVPAEERRDDEKIYHKMTINDLSKRAPAINWLDYYRYAFNQVGRKIGANEPIVVYSPEYLGNMSQLVYEYMRDNTHKT